MTSARGDLVLVSNLANPQTDVDTIAWPGLSAQGFVTGDSAWSLTSIEAVLGGVEQPDLVNASATLYASTVDGNGVDVPDVSTSLATFVFPALDIDQAARTFTPTSSVVLQANTEYWFVLTNLTADAAPFHWTYTNDTANNPAYQGQLTTLRTSSDSGATWNSPIVPYAYQLQVNGAPVSVPEPSGWVLVGLGFSMVLALGHRRRFRPIAG
jgi:hypothetical protein